MNVRKRLFIAAAAMLGALQLQSQTQTQCEAFSSTTISTLVRRYGNQLTPMTTTRTVHWIRQHRTSSTSTRSSTTSLKLGGSDAAVATTSTTLAGEMAPFFSKVCLGQATFGTVYASLAQAVDLREFVTLISIAWGAVPLVKRFYEIYNQSFRDSSARTFTSSFWYTWAINLSQAAKVGVFIYLADCLGVILNAMGFRYLQTVGFSSKAANISIFLWLSLRFKILKRWLLKKWFIGKGGDGGIAKARVADRVSDAVLYIVTATIIIDRLDLDFGATLSSLFAFGGVGTLVFSLASKDLASHIVSGLSVKGANTFNVGDSIQLGDGTSGTVSKIGLLYTEIRGGDEIITRIPNTHISNQRTSNISRVNKSQVKQTLWFSYDDIEKLPNVIKAIRQEIIDSCPDLITDGSRPFRVHWSTYESDHLEVEVDCRFNLPPKGNVYHDNRQAVLEAIARAVRNEGVEFAIPSYVSRNVEHAALKKKMQLVDKKENDSGDDEVGFATVDLNAVPESGA